MKVLLDTHILLWAIGDPAKLPVTVRDAILDQEVELVVSSVSLAEIEIKKSIGRLTFDFSLRDIEQDLRHRWLAFEVRHAERLGALPLHHRDPFDRMLIAQAASDDLVIASVDERFVQYDVPVL